ncbi:uncharacterized protein LDX57_009390 [Aspergillus melleus]|uniref:uncharacterized protein n=1 Tax=Aspergillus melleus TaxID=138277 RepID=UPI001E8D428C|nr:uncharacterized protein LDX57_009390 [Aspergillus melleus]KAH8431735.1 hypothetical protein LDX57_009390 [Aspergillus melleus]
MPESAPQLHIPASKHTVDVSIIDSTARIKIPLQAFIKDPLPGHEHLQCPAYSFLVEHPSGKKVLFDLGVRKDFDRAAPALLNAWKGRLTLNVEDDIAGILKKDGRVGLEEINSIIWR